MRFIVFMRERMRRLVGMNIFLGGAFFVALLLSIVFIAAHSTSIISRVDAQSYVPTLPGGGTTDSNGCYAYSAAVGVTWCNVGPSYVLNLVSGTYGDPYGFVHYPGQCSSQNVNS